MSGGDEANPALPTRDENLQLGDAWRTLRGPRARALHVHLRAERRRGARGDAARDRGQTVRRFEVLRRIDLEPCLAQPLALTLAPTHLEPGKLEPAEAASIA